MKQKTIDTVGIDWLITETNTIIDNVEHVLPSEYNEKTRYLPSSVTSLPGLIRYSVNPFMREIVDCFDIKNPVKEVNLMKGVQVTYSTVLESGVLYYADHVGTLPIMYITADKELASARIENNFIPMFNESGKGGIIRSSDITNTRKTGKTANHIQFEKGGYLVPFGARNADKMRSYSIAIMLKDEIDAWPDVVGKDGDPDALSDSRTDGYSEQKKIFRGSTPLIKQKSKIYKNYLKGDQRRYHVKCKHCGEFQYLRWEHIDKESGIIGGFKWDLDENNRLIVESVRYDCIKCGGSHYEADKEKLYSEENGAHWKPTAIPTQPNIRSYHLPALYSPVGMRPWYENVMQYLEAYDPASKKIKDIGKYQVFYNNILGKPFEIMHGSKLRFQTASSHRRAEYSIGTIPNNYAIKHSGSKILMLTCTVDVHKDNLAVAVFGWCKDMICYLIDYWRFEIKQGEPECPELSSPVWNDLRDLIENKEYVADDETRYTICNTFIDAGFANSTVVSFCADYTSNVYPILGRDRAGKNQRIKEFSEFTTIGGTIGYKITVDHYKDRLSTVLKREWIDTKPQNAYHFNAPSDLPDKALKELTVESRREKTDDKGVTTYYWHRPSGAANELWDLLVYGHCSVELIASKICMEMFEMENVDWIKFWDVIEAEQYFFY